MQTYDLFAFTRNSDMTEGRGPMVVVGYTKDKSVACSIVNDPRFYKKYGVMGCASDPEYQVQEKQIQVYQSAEDFFTNDDAAKKKAIALAKLTPEEKRILGLT